MSVSNLFLKKSLNGVLGSIEHRTTKDGVIFISLHFISFYLFLSVTYKSDDYRHFEVPAASMPAAYIDPVLLQRQRDENAVFTAHAVAAAAAAHARYAFYNVVVVVVFVVVVVVEKLNRRNETFYMH